MPHASRAVWWRKAHTLSPCAIGYYRETLLRVNGEEDTFGSFQGSTVSRRAAIENVNAIRLMCSRSTSSNALRDVGLNADRDIRHHDYRTTRRWASTPVLGIRSP